MQENKFDKIQVEDFFEIHSDKLLSENEELAKNLLKLDQILVF